MGDVMRRRTLLQSLGAAALLPITACAERTAAPTREIMTVSGLIPASEMGFTLTHEHVIADVRPIAEQIANPITPDPDEVAAVMSPYLNRIRELGCRTLIDATGVGIGRHAAVVRAASQASGLHMMVSTGAYGAADYQFLPPYVREEETEQIAARWIGEWRDGIDGTDIRPGMIKISVNGAGELSDVEQKLIRAAAATHRESGLVIGSHTGPAPAAFAQLAELQTAGIDPAAWIWIHAQNEPDHGERVRAAAMGAWVSLDGVSADNVAAYVAMITRMRDDGFLHRTLVSHDAGWYTVGQPNGGEPRPYDTIFTGLVPALSAAGFSQDEIDAIFIENPANAFAIGARFT